MVESTVEKYLKNQCKLNDYLCYKFISPSQKGVPDRILIGGGHDMFVETKAPNKRPRKLQERVFKRMREHGSLVFVIDTKEKVDSFFEQIKIKDIHDISINVIDE